MSLKDIEKLKEKVDKDPNSKLFVPLAEEYRKEGMLDEAIGVLLSGVEKQPGYMSARVSLGKIYVEKEMLKEAQAEFEQVIKSIPDNLYAHKKLADIYRSTGDTQQAIRSYKTVLRLNAMDEEALISLSELEGLELQEASMEKPASQQQTVEAAGVFPDTEHAAEEAAPVVGFVPESEVTAEPIREEDLAAFQSAIFGATEEYLNASPGDLLSADLASEDEPYDAATEVTDTEMTLTDNSEGDNSDVFELEDLKEDDFGQALTMDQPVEDIFTLQQPTHEQTVPEEIIPAQIPAAASASTLEDADREVSDGNYGNALKIYRELLTANPGDRHILQRVEELRQFLKMIGKDKDALIEQLNNFLGGIEKRRDEFHRST
ncbi:MAG: hypothetical protein C0402_14315 [Thermodesulfovibrio sp.]|nr:hypothetical protein [Thermodesulfovibrio sp.]